MAPVTDRSELVTSRLIDRIGRVDLRVTDVDRALTFYRDVVGLHVVENDGPRAALGGAGDPAFLTLDSTGVSEPADPLATGLFHHAIRFPTRASLGDALARLVAAGYEIGAGDHLVSEALYVDDPDGNGVELYWDRPSDEWPPPSGDMLVPMATLPVDLPGLLADGQGRAAVDEEAPRGTDMGHVHLQASDIDVTIGFYSDLLGLDLTGRLGGSAAFFSSNGYHHHIGANTWRSRGNKPTTQDRAGLARVVFEVSEKDELEALRARLAAGGREVSGDASTYIVHDPDGIELHFTHA